MPLYGDYYGSSPYAYGGGLSPYGSPYSSSSAPGFSKMLSSVLNYGLDMPRGGVISISNSPGPYYLDTRSWVAPMSPRLGYSSGLSSGLSSSGYRPARPKWMDVSDIDVTKPRGRRAIAAAANAALRTASPSPAVAVPVAPAVAAPAPVDGVLTDRVRAERAVERALIERGGNKCTIKRDRTVVRLRTKKETPAQAERRRNRQKTPGERLVEKFLIKDKSLEEERQRREEEEERQRRRAARLADHAIVRRNTPRRKSSLQTDAIAAVAAAAAQEEERVEEAPADDSAEAQELHVLDELILDEMTHEDPVRRGSSTRISYKGYAPAATPPDIEVSQHGKRKSRRRSSDLNKLVDSISEDPETESTAAPMLQRRLSVKRRGSREITATLHIPASLAKSGSASKVPGLAQISETSVDDSDLPGQQTSPKIKSPAALKIVDVEVEVTHSPKTPRRFVYDVVVDGDDPKRVPSRKVVPSKAETVALKVDEKRTLQSHVGHVEDAPTRPNTLDLTKSGQTTKPKVPVLEALKSVEKTPSADTKTAKAAQTPSKAQPSPAATPAPATPAKTPAAAKTAAQTPTAAKTVAQTPAKTPAQTPTAAKTVAQTPAKTPAQTPAKTTVGGLWGAPKAAPQTVAKVQNQTPTAAKAPVETPVPKQEVETPANSHCRKGRGGNARRTVANSHSSEGTGEKCSRTKSSCANSHCSQGPCSDSHVTQSAGRDSCCREAATANSNNCESPGPNCGEASCANPNSGEADFRRYSRGRQAPASNSHSNQSPRSDSPCREAGLSGNSHCNQAGFSRNSKSNKADFS
ncbi:neurofilament heavy polypeptide-like [Thrips palmi]|uniref:Neurofilament heavy polypeptide-like n=1 Tax=Thrips palmi TaxID=161013 RepID=A0A6P8YZV6_THRPL|nr:neurofilament heavy polypeptide-like [Thrips palmi]